MHQEAPLSTHRASRIAGCTPHIAAIAAAWLYASGLAALALLWAGQPAAPAWLALSNIFAPLLFAPLLPLAAAALLLRSRPMLPALLLPAALFAALFGRLFLPPGTAPEPGPRLRVATLNALYTNCDVAALAAALRSADADVVVLQELSPRVADGLRTQIGAAYPYQHLSPHDSPAGMGIFSRLPLRPVFRRGFPGQLAQVEVDGTDVLLLNVHLPAPEWRRGFSTSRRDAAAPRLLAAIDQAPGPLVAAGDFNTAERERLYGALAARLTDAFRRTERGFGFTFPNGGRMGPAPAPFPLVRLDYIWSGRGVAPLAARVDCRASGSDHCLVIADLRLTAAGTAERGWLPW
jgi:vancomycin resistance protein VanJ